jgi:hypothetical protein
MLGSRPRRDDCAAETCNSPPSRLLEARILDATQLSPRCASGRGRRRAERLEKPEKSVEPSALVRKSIQACRKCGMVFAREIRLRLRTAEAVNIRLRMSAARRARISDKGERQFFATLRPRAARCG